jgi:DCC1-like thiol-disulfide oxidoreductase
VQSVVLFDGVCNLCNGFVQFVIARDRRNRFQFAALQSPPAQRLLAPLAAAADALDTMILIEDGRVFTRSAAALRVGSRFRGRSPTASSSCRARWAIGRTASSRGIGIGGSGDVTSAWCRRRSTVRNFSPIERLFAVQPDHAH